MKKFIVTILSLLYITTSVGATVHLHYCMDKLVDWELWQNSDKKCGRCGMEKSQEKENGCCKDEHKQVKLDNDHKGTVAFQFSELSVVVIPAPIFELFHTNLPSVTERNPLSHAPPRSCDITVYIRNCVFRI